MRLDPRGGDAREDRGEDEEGGRVDREQTVKLDGSLVLAISPPTRPPSPMPRFIVTRCCANAAGRRSAGVSADRSVPWLGQKAPLPVPASALTGTRATLW